MKNITWAVTSSYPILMSIWSLVLGHYALASLSIIGAVVLHPYSDDWVDSKPLSAYGLIALRILFILSALYTIAFAKL
jgi:uncharacterized membrane protein